MNKELVLREHLAIERTKLGNERTLLSYIRTGLYFLVAGTTLGQLMETAFWRTMGDPLLIAGILIVIIGAVRFVSVHRTIAESRKNIGAAGESFIKAVRGE